MEINALFTRGPLVLGAGGGKGLLTSIVGRMPLPEAGTGEEG
jgi:hypothetical protein